MITMTNLQGILATCFGVDPSVVVPKQGNWFNPQDDSQKAATWVAYRMRHIRPRTLPFMQPNPGFPPIATTFMTADIDVQIVGDLAETIAQSMSLWLYREDIKNLFDSYQAQLMGDDLGSYEITDFSQEGLNTVLAYNVRFSIQWANMIQSSQIQLTTADWTDTLNIGT